MNWKPVIQGPLSLSGYDYVTVDLKAETDKWKFSCGRRGRRTNRSCTLNLAQCRCSVLCGKPGNHNNFYALSPRFPAFILPNTFPPKTTLTHLHNVFIWEAVVANQVCVLYEFCEIKNLRNGHTNALANKSNNLK